MSEHDKCKACNAEIIWIKTTGGKNMPCNPKKKTIITSVGQVYQGYESHFATCPMADKFRKDKMTQADKVAESIRTRKD